MKKWSILFVFLLAFCVFVECYDLYWSIKLQDVLYKSELNPFGRFLMDLDGGSVALFMAVKVASICLITAALPLLFVFRPRLAWILLTISVIWRLALLLFLEFGHLLFAH